MAQTQVQPRGGDLAAQEPEAGRARWRRPNRPILVGAGLIVLAVIWWAISYSQIAGAAGFALADTTQCLFFRGAFCRSLIGEADLSFPLYYHLFSMWPGLLLLMIGLWRMTPFSSNPPDWFIPYRITLFRILAVTGFIVLWWEGAARAGPNLLADPASTFAAAVDMLGEDRNRLRLAFFDSLRVYLSGFAFGSLVGIPIGLIFGGFRILGQTMEVFMNALMATPRIAFIPLIILFLGLGYEAKAFVVFLGAVMPIMVNTYAGVRHSDGELVEMARSAGARRGQIFVRIMLPGALPFIVVGLRIGATIGLINTVVAELYLATSGLGGLITEYRRLFSPPNYLVVVLCLSLIGVVVTSLLRILESRADRWRYSGD